MGLDIRYFSNMIRVECSNSTDDDCWTQGHRQVTAWDGAEAPFEVGVCYMPAVPEQIAHRLTGEPSNHFRAGSYSGYSFWRNRLSEFAFGVPAMAVWEKYEDYEGKPFARLINFSDCEGSIGSLASAALAQDFLSHQEKAEAFFEPWEYELYCHWLRAFTAAADGGWVNFQ
jgi:hypothetical protein